MHYEFQWYFILYFDALFYFYFTIFTERLNRLSLMYFFKILCSVVFLLFLK